MATSTLSREWDDHTCQADRDLPIWAATDRGWLFATVDGFTVCLGHYLDHATAAPGEYPFGTIHAVSCVGRCAEHFADIAEARRYIDDRAQGAIALAYVLSEMVCRGRIHRAEADAIFARECAAVSPR
jgi:hypothetical protein